MHSVMRMGVLVGALVMMVGAPARANDPNPPTDRWVRFQPSNSAPTDRWVRQVPADPTTCWDQQHGTGAHKNSGGSYWSCVGKYGGGAGGDSSGDGLDGGGADGDASDGGPGGSPGGGAPGGAL